MTTAPPPPWHAAFPSPSNPNPPSITARALLTRLQSQSQDQQSHTQTTITTPTFLLIDLRRTDHEGGTIRTSLNLPAQTLYHSLPTLYALCEGAGVGEVVFYCGSSRGRGPRAAGWFEDYIRTHSPPDSQKVLKSLILEGGIKGWVEEGAEYIKEMEGYVEDVWVKGLGIC